ncbi:MAG: hypothetical protein F6J93_07500 [Oscillatoria sp. SIO1A7]|nr:hypothetical protein [Oscillatoria sp. SIO1A7]
MNNYENEDARAKNERSLLAISRAIRFSQGQFSLILLRCNYASVRDRMAEKLRQKSQVEIKEFVLPETLQSLYRTIRAKAEQDPPNVLMVFGLESVGNLEELLASTNGERENYRQSFPFPLLLWIGDDILKTLIRLAPDFESWATGSEFVLSNDELMTLLEESTDRVFEAVLEAGSGWFAANTAILGDRYRLEFDAALRDLQRRGVELDRALQARVEFAVGRDLYIEDKIDEALAKYRQSLAYWQQEDNRDNKQDRDRENNKKEINSISEPGNGEKDALAIAAGAEALFWEMSEPGSEGEWYPYPGSPFAKTPEPKVYKNQRLVRQGVLLFHIGLCYCRKAEIYQAEREQHLKQAKYYLEQCVDALEKSRRPDLVAKFLGQLGEILERLEEWEALADLATKSLKLDKDHGSQHHLAQDYGFLAEVALQHSQWKKALEFANKALAAEAKAEEPWLQYRAHYLLLLARAQAGLGQGKWAIANLEKARDQSNPEYDPQLDIRILNTLREFHFQQGHYREAFTIKQERRAIEAMFGLRAFIGAGRLQSQRNSVNLTTGRGAQQETVALEIETSGRKRDLENIIRRLSRNDYKLTVIHGQSGVGKSSLLYAGLIPALKQKAIAARVCLPVPMQVYFDWAGTLEKLLNEALMATLAVVSTGEKNLHRSERMQDRVALSSRRQKTRVAWRGNDRRGKDWRSGMATHKPAKQNIFRDMKEERHSAPPLELSRNQAIIEKILKQLRENGDRNLLTVLIFDQFEEFFLSNYSTVAKKQFYQFLRDCMNLPFVKIIVSLREDYLHYLLEWERLEILADFTQDLLKKEIRYYVGNFSPEDACSVIKSLSERSQFHLEDLLIDTVVSDLASELGEVRPIELQLVGAQLQSQKIATQEKYQQFGSKEKLIENFLEEVVKDCGSENEEAARLLLYFLTDEHGIRRRRTRDELVEDLGAKHGQNEKMDLLLTILVHSGLVSMLPEVPENRYQLVHDYLVEFIRGQEAVKNEAELKALREENRQLQKEAKWQAKLAESIETKKKIQDSRNKILKAFLSASFIGFITVVGLLFGVGFLWQKEEFAAEQAERARQRAAIAEIEARNSASKALLLSENELEALVASVQAASKVPDNPVSRPLKSETLKRLYGAIYAVTERNRLEAHSNSVLDVAFSPDGQLIASASADNTFILWNRDGSVARGDTKGNASADNRAQIKAHDDSLTAISFSPDGKLIATASTDKTAKLWSRDGTAIATLGGHKELVSAISFSPDGELIATASADMTVKLWRLDGTLLKTIKAHDHWVMDVSFSPDGQTFATVSRDETLKLWKRDGTLIKKIKDPYNSIVAVSFSPDGKLIATAGNDNNVKVWQSDGTLLGTFSGHEDWVRDVTFSPDGQTIASASKDNTVLLWKLDGSEIARLQGHQGQVFSVSFSPDGKTLASGSKDNTVKIWESYDRHFPMLEGQTDGLLDVSFSPDGRTIATASKDGTVGLFAAADRKPLQIIKSHDDAVNGVSFSPDGQLVASAGEDNGVKIWDLDGNLIRAIAAHTKPVNGVSFSPDGQFLATASSDKTAKIWRLDGSWVATLAGHGDAVTSISFSANGKLIVTTSADNTARLWTSDSFSKSNPEPLKVLNQHKKKIWYASFSPDNKLIATASADNTVNLWLRNGNLLSTLEGHIGPVNWVAFSPDGETIATASDDKTVKLWTRDGKLLTTFEGHKDKVFGLSFSPDGKTLVSASGDKTAILWNLDLQDLLGHGCAWVVDYLQTNPQVKISDRSLCESFEF